MNKKNLKSEPEFNLTKDELYQLQELVDKCIEGFNSFDDNEFLKNLPLYAYKLPTRLVKFLNEFKYNPHESGYSVVSTGIVNAETLPPTPPHWQLKSNNDGCKEAMITMCMCSAVLGDIYGWLTQQDGRVIHDILPIKKYENEQLGSSSNEELTWHTEDAFHELRGDYLVMMCLRNNNKIPTTLSKPDYRKLTEKQINILFEKNFTIKPDNSHKPEFGSDDRIMSNQKDNLHLDSTKNLNEAYKAIIERNKQPEKIAVLFGNKKDPSLRLDPFFMEKPTCPEINEALNAIIALVTESLVEVALKPGQILIVDNYEVVHGRRAFKARYDGTDRWYKRINVIRDIRRCQHVLKDKSSRVIY